jgi:hypothetical protein
LLVLPCPRLDCLLLLLLPGVAAGQQLLRGHALTAVQKDAPAAGWQA